MLKKFNSNDIFINRIKTYPKVSIFVHNGKIYYNNDVKIYDMLPDPPISSAILKEDGCYLLTEDGYLILLETDL